MSSPSWSLMPSCVRVAGKPSTIWPKSVFSTAPLYAPVVQSSADVSVFLNFPCPLSSPYWFTLLPPSGMSLFANPGSAILPTAQGSVDLLPPWSRCWGWLVPDKVWLLNKCLFSSSFINSFFQCIIPVQNNFPFSSILCFYSSSSSHLPKLLLSVFFSF